MSRSDRSAFFDPAWPPVLERRCSSWPVSPASQDSLLQLLCILHLRQQLKCWSWSCWTKARTRAAPHEEVAVSSCLQAEKATSFSKLKYRLVSWAARTESTLLILSRRPGSRWARKNSLSCWLVIIISTFPCATPKRLSRSTSNLFLSRFESPIADSDLSWGAHTP